VENEIKVSLTALDGGTGLFTDFDEDEARIAAILRYALAAAPLMERAQRLAEDVDASTLYDDIESLRASQPWSDA